jgi:CheY-like chemotaxis protein/signal transduction histidine kinase
MTPWRHLSVEARLLAGFAAVLLIALLLVTVGLMRLNDLHQQIGYLVDNRMENLYLAGELRQDIYQAQHITLDIIHTGQESASDSRAMIEQLRRKNNARAVDLGENLQTRDGRRLWDDMQATRDRARPLLDQTLTLALAGQQAQALQLFREQAEPAHAAWGQTIQALVLHLKHKVGEAHAQTDSVYRFGRQIMLALAGLALLLGAALALALARSISMPLNMALKAANQIAKGAPYASRRDFFEGRNNIAGQYAFQRRDEVGRTLGTMLDNLWEFACANYREQWFKTGQRDLADSMRGRTDIEDLARTIITFVARYVSAQVGVIYVADGDAEGTLRLCASYAHTRRKRLAEQVRPGQGLVGQALLERQVIMVSDLPEDYISVSSGLGESPPRHLLVMPLEHEGQIKGALELGALLPISDIQLEFLQSVADSIAIALHAACNQTELARLLDRSQTLSEELQAQQEELRASNEELEEQARLLRQSKERLKAQSEELQQTNAELEEKSENLERQKSEMQLQNDQLENARQALEQQAGELERASRYKSEFLANMSHELRTPLNSLLILAKDLLDNEEGNLSAEQLESLTIIRKGGMDLLTLINEILDLSKIEAGKMTLELQPLALRELADSLRAQFEPVARQKDLSFSTILEPGLPAAIEVDPLRLGQILKNLLSNAFKFTSRGSVTLRIEPHPATPSGQPGLAFAVQDTGIGIPSDKQQDIFEAFQQADGSTVRRYGGTGLGLTISRELARLLEGCLQLVSEPGVGSTFTLVLPLHKARPEDEAAASVEQARPAVLPDVPAAAIEPVTLPAIHCDDDRDIVRHDDKSLLVVEDDAIFARTVLDMAAKRGFKRLAAASGQAGLAMAQKHQPSAIILDLGLPDLAGQEVLRQLKSDRATRHIPVHIVSARDRDMSFMRQGALGFISKPASRDDLGRVFEQVEDLLDKEVRELLIIEDDPSAQKALVTLLDNDDIRITCLASAEQALPALQTQRYDCIILDLTLPGLSGQDFLRELHAACADSGPPPIIVYTGQELSEDAYHDLSAFADSVVVKGIHSPERLLAEATLFLHTVDRSLPDAPGAACAAPAEKDDVLRNRGILLVDDDIRNTFALSQVLRKHGLQVTLADDGHLALDKLAADAGIELVLMDIMMPVMDGYEAMRRIRAQQQFRDLPIIALTAKAMAEDRALCLEAGANDYLAKPVDLDRLLSLLRVYLSRRG